jgi:two-component system, NtrC family, response regulator HydG
MSGEYQPTPRGRILLVEDDPDTARFIMRVLVSRGGFDVEHAPSPAVALPQVDPERWDLIITDIEMPDMTGLELLETVRQQAPDLPVVVVTAHVTVDNGVAALRGRADELLRKPLRPDGLVQTVTDVLARNRAAHQIVLAVGAHPGDIEIGAAGTLLAHRAAGDEIAILTMSRGARGGADGALADESREAARLLGADLYLEDMDARISESDPTISVIRGVTKAVKPTMLYTHSIHDVQQDHRNTHRAAMVAARGIGSVYCFQSPSATVDFRPARFNDIEEQITGKLAAISAFASQAAVRQYLEPDLIEATARYWSRYGSSRYAEAFEVVRDHAAGPAGRATVRSVADAAASAETAQILEVGHAS